MAINSFEFLHNDTIFGLSNCRADNETVVPECGSNTDSTARTAGARTASSTFTTSSTIKTPSTASKTKLRSPYLATDKVHMVSRRTEQTCMQRTATSIVSSFPYAADIYKASSDQFRALRNNKKRKPKKSVLTLPTQPAPMPQECTVSDMNESEYYMRDELEKNKPKRITQMKKKKNKSKKTQKIIDRDMKYCRQFNIDLYCSSTDSTTKADFCDAKPKSTSLTKSTKRQEPHDVWSVLRSINKFQFRPTPDSSIGSKKKKGPKKHRRDDRAVDSVYASCCTTEEFAYISTVDIQQDDCKKSSSSGITVIGDRDQFAKLCKRTTQNIREKLALKEREKLVQNERKTPSPKYKKPGVAQVNARNARRKALLKSALQTQKKYSIVTDFNGNGNTCRSNIISTKSSKDSLEFKNEVPLGVRVIGNKTYSNFRKNLNKGDEITADAAEKQKDPLNDIIKVILHKGKDSSNARRLPSPVKERKPRLCTTLTSAPYVPHLTKTEIRKQMYRLKFPIVVLGKEELTSAYYVMNEELPPQFGGLDTMSWPFMREWYDIKENIKFQIHKDIVPPKADSKMKSKMNSKHKIDNVINSDVEALYKPKRDVSSYSKSQQSRKSICNLKDKVLEILSKKSSRIKCNIQSLANKVGSDNSNQKILVGDSSKTADTNTEYETEKSVRSIPAKLSICNGEVPIRSHKSPLRSPMKGKGAWCRAQGYNEFIDNIIKKISAGIYYSQDKKKIQTLGPKEAAGYKEAEAQTLVYNKTTMSPKVDTEEKGFKVDLDHIHKYDHLTAIGFDEVVSGLQIESLNESQISVKHCITNIVIHFDITLLPITPYVSMDSRGISCKPLFEGPAGAFKCDNILINNMLPAELCTVMPKMMRDILRNMRASAPSSESITQVNTQEKAKLQPILPAIAETIIVKNDVAPAPHLSKELLDIIVGNFKPAADHAKFKVITVNSNILKVSRRRSDLLTVPKTLWYLNTKVRAMPRIREKLVSVGNKGISLDSFKNASINELKTVPHCTALQPFIRREPRLISYDEYTLSNMAQNIINLFMGQPICNATSYLYPLLNTILDRQLSISIELESSKNFSVFNFDKAGIVARITNKSDFTKKPVIIVDYVETDTNILEDNNDDNIADICEQKVESTKTLQIIGSVESNRNEPNSPIHLEEQEECFQELPEKCEKNDKSERIKNLKYKKKRFIKLYRKCKSTTNISEKPATTQLSKINSLEDFFQALGPDKSLATVFDGTPGKKMLEYLKEMRLWITEITPKQAILVLLLVNKKETPSLTRFRQIILQAIAVNRITRASELDMEIEVIEREKFQINTEVSNNTWMPAIPQNDDLLEELCWIAKTTASDYQRPFDETSETLLKSLIEKRKQLNPSYLRVMARYVGLGLLKAQSKN